MSLPETLPDWSLLRVFLAVAETGSHSAAARLLGSSQPTVGRQIAQLEATLGTVLFARHAQGVRLTDAGADLMAPARAMEAAVREIGLKAAGRSQAVAGTVRITASVAMAHGVLPPIVAGIIAAHPEIAIEIAPNDRAENLLFREADIAVRMFRPEQLDVVTRHIGDMPLGLFGATSYLDRRGRPVTMDDLRDHDFVGYDRDDQIIRGFRDRGLGVGRDFFRTRCDMQSVYWELVRAGCGLGFGQIIVGTSDPGLEQVVPDMDLPLLPVWLTAHEAMRQTPRIRRVWDMLAEGLRAALP